MIVDTSVIVALALEEPEQFAFLQAMYEAPSRSMSAGNWIELSAVAVRRKLFGMTWLNRVCENYDIAIVPVTAEQAQIGHEAYRRYGLGSGDKAKLNFGDCFAYALAKATGEPLLFKGNDFTYTDVLPAIEGRTDD